MHSLISLDGLGPSSSLHQRSSNHVVRRLGGTQAARLAARAIDALRRGWPIAIGSGKGSLVLLAIETADPVRLATFDPNGNASLLISAGRAVALDFNGGFAALDPDAPVRLWSDEGFDLAVATMVADPQFDTMTSFTGPIKVVERDPSPVARAALHLAMRAGILPAFFVATSGAVDVALSIDDIAAHDDASRLTIATRARLPVAATDDVKSWRFARRRCRASILLL
jgi:GTP cyclohydrolase II